MAAKFEPGSWVWIQDAEEIYLPAKVLKGFGPGEETTVRTEDGEDHKLDAAASGWVTSCAEEILDCKIDDMINISDLNEMAILHSLRIRFREDLIYTSISSILISVNPFRQLPLYNPDILAKYRDGGRDLAPHVFNSAKQAYEDMLNNQRDNSVVISGESGAGKSEAMKLILQFLTDVSSRADAKGSSDTKASSNLEQQILAANPILEAFGNAKTSRNNNSSRFGKLITINFDSAGGITGGGIINYLLEKSRVVQQNLDERNYHIFYQLLSAGHSDPALASALKLQNAELFDITNPQGKGVVPIDGHSDEKEFEDMQNSMRVLNFPDEDKQGTFKIVAGVLHFGNVKFSEGKSEESCVIANEEVVDHAAAMFGIEPSDAKRCLTSRFMGAHSVVVVPYNVEQAVAARDAMIKRVYADLFQIMVNKINKVLSEGGAVRHKFIGVLDIFGFESFEVNSFEQLCINFCNEKLQFHFNEHIFKMEQTLYAEENIVIPGSSFVDNQAALDLLELKGTGVFSMIDEEINVPRGSDDGLLGKLLKNHEKHENMVRPKSKACKDSLKCFGITHYAGTVYYNINNFLDKNKDQLHPDICAVLQGSSIPLIASMFAPDPNAESTPPSRGRGGPKKSKTLGAQFKTQLNDLISTLNQTNPNFVRCMKSNDKKVGRIFHASRMREQLRYSGLVEVCRIRKLGYPVRRPFEEFYKRYRCICMDLNSPDLDSMLASLSASGVLAAGEWAKGKTRMFLRTSQASALEVKREEALARVVLKVQKCMRRKIEWLRYKRMINILHNCVHACETRTEEALVEAIEMTSELPFNGSHVKAVKDARALLVVIQEENRVFKLLEAAMSSGELNSLKSAVHAASAAHNPVAKLTKLVEKAQEMIKKIEAELETKAGLKAATASKSLVDLAKFISDAQSQGANVTTLPEYSTAVALERSLKEEEGALKELESAVASGDLQKMTGSISKCNDLGLGSRDVVKSAVAAKDKILAERGAAEQEAQRKADEESAAKRTATEKTLNDKLAAACAGNNATRINELLYEAIESGISGTAVDAARDLLGKLSVLDDKRNELSAAEKTLVMKAHTGISEGDLKEFALAITSSKDAAAATATSANPSLPFPELDNAEVAYTRYQGHCTIQAVLIAATDSQDRVKLNDAVSQADNINVPDDLEAYRLAKEALRSVEIAYREEKAAKTGLDGEGEEEEEEEDYDEAEEKRQAKQEAARQPRFDWRNFLNLRSPDDFARGFLFKKTQVKESFLVWSDEPVPKSMTVINDSESHKRAKEMHLNVLGYMGDKHLPYPSMLAQDLLRTGVASKELRDELYVNSE